MTEADIYNDAWTSLTVWVQSLRSEFPHHKLRFIDWEALGDSPKLPETDLIGPLALAVSEYDSHMFEVNFSIGISIYEKDANLFRLREYVGRVFRAMTSESRIPYFDASNSLEVGVMVMTPGTRVAPMNEVQVRPFQYIQGTALIVPGSSAA